MTKYKKNQLLITKRYVGISVDGDVESYQIDEVFEILEVIEKEGGICYRIDFGIDRGEKQYYFDEDTISSFVEEEDYV